MTRSILNDIAFGFSEIAELFYDFGIQKNLAVGGGFQSAIYKVLKLRAGNFHLSCYITAIPVVNICNIVTDLCTNCGFLSVMPKKVDVMIPFGFLKSFFREGTFYVAGF